MNLFLLQFSKKFSDKRHLQKRLATRNGNATMRSPFNPNGSMCAIEGITSRDGRVYGKMGHSERRGINLYKNFTGSFDMRIFESGVKYFK